MSNAALNTQTPQRFSGEWETKQLGELGPFVKGRGIKRDDVSYEGLPCIRYGELYTLYKDYILKVESRIPPSVAETALPIKTGDLLFAGSGETAEEIGRCAAYLGEEQAYAGCHRVNTIGAEFDLSWSSDEFSNSVGAEGSFGAR